MVCGSESSEGSTSVRKGYAIRIRSIPVGGWRGAVISGFLVNLVNAAGSKRIMHAAGAFVSFELSPSFYDET
jgi:hypothetical protein